MDNNWTTWNTQAMQALDRGDIEQAERAFRQACGSGDPRADSNLGWFYFLMGGSVRDSEAEARYWIQKALQRSRHPLILQNIARLRFENGDFAGALAALQEAHRADQSPVLLYNLGVCHFGWGTKLRLRPASTRQTQRMPPTCSARSAGRSIPALPMRSARRAGNGPLRCAVTRLSGTTWSSGTMFFYAFSVRRMQWLPRYCRSWSPSGR